MNLQNEILKAITSVIEIEKLLDIMTKSLKQELSLNCCAIILYKNPPELDDDICMVQSELATQEEDYLLQKISDGCLKKYLVKKEGFAEKMPVSIIHIFKMVDIHKCKGERHPVFLSII